MNLRERAFWIVDALGGQPVRSQLLDLERMMSADHEGDQTRASRLTALLGHARSEVPFYSEIADLNLSSFPVVNKGVLKQEGPRMLAAGTDPSRFHVASTSGSTGIPLRVVQDRRKRARSNAETIYWGRMAGYNVGNPLIHMKVWSGRNRISRVSRLARNVHPVDVTAMTRADYRELVSELTGSKKTVSIISYASALESLARAAAREDSVGSIGSNVASVIAQSEGLSMEARRQLGESLGVCPYSRYGLEELGIVAQQVVGSGESYKINSATFVVEILRTDSDVPAEPGEVGRIVVTDLANYAQPMVRYDTGDLGSFALKEDGKVDSTWLERIEGRALDQILDCNDQPVSPMLMYKIWWKYPEIEQYQLVQRGKGDYVVRLNTSRPFTASDKIEKDMADLMGPAAKVAIELTDETLVLGSGKRKSVVAEYRPSEVRQ